MPSSTIGYARTSTRDQVAGLEAQKRDLEKAGCERVFHEQLSSVDKDRSELRKVLDYVRQGDTLVVTKMDRLARSVADLLKIKEQVDGKGVSLKILSPEIDTSTPAGRLTFAMFGAIAQFEREIMLERQREGIAKAKAEGRYTGRAPTARRQADKVIAMKKEGVSADQIAARLEISRSSVFRIFREHSKLDLPQR